jgi:hypothetical protein
VQVAGSGDTRVAALEREVESFGEELNEALGDERSR